MQRALELVAIVLLIANLSFAQTTPKKPATAARPRPAGPTHVTGAPVTTASGLQYWNLKLGTGALAIPGKKAKVQYAGWLTTGKKFDSGVFEFTIGNGEVIKGWDEGIAGMKVGGKRQLRIPPSLAYGAAGRPPVIPENSTLIFDVQLMGAE